MRAILSSAARLAEFPLSGRSVRMARRADVREILVFRYRVIYQVLPGRVEIVDVRHAARRLDVHVLREMLARERRPPRA